MKSCNNWLENFKKILSLAYTPNSSLDQKIQAFEQYIESCAECYSQVSFDWYKVVYQQIKTIKAFLL